MQGADCVTVWSRERARGEADQAVLVRTKQRDQLAGGLEPIGDELAAAGERGLAQMCGGAIQVLTQAHQAIRYLSQLLGHILDAALGARQLELTQLSWQC